MERFLKEGGLFFLMVKIDEVELKLIENGSYDNYESYVKKDPKFDAIPYMMALSETFEEVCSQDKLMMIGGLGVLVNLVKNEGTEIIPHWRGTHDLDVVLFNKKCINLIPEIFDSVDVPVTRSHSVYGKYTTRGKSRDINGRCFNSIPIDIYGPNGDPKEGIVLNGYTLDELSWSKMVNADFFGVNVNSLGLLDSLFLKTDVFCENSPLLLREQDQQDIYHLLACTEREGYSPQEIHQKLGDLRYIRLVTNLEYYLENSSKSKPLIKISNQYLEELVKGI